MRRFFWRRGGEAELAARLKRRRQRARSEFVNELAREVRSTGGRRFVPSRVLVAAALTFVMLVALASVGGSAGAGVRAQLVAVVKSVSKKAKFERVTVQQPVNDDDDDGGSSGGGGGGGNDDDDDGGSSGGGGVGGRDDDDDDGDDDQYEEDGQECELALQQAHGSFHQQSYTWRGHRLYHQSLARALDDCDEIDDDD